MIEWITDFFLNCWTFFKGWAFLFVFLLIATWLCSQMDANPKKADR